MNSFDDTHLSQIVDAHLEAVLSGETTVDAVLAQYPHVAEELARELELAVWVAARRANVTPRPGFVSSSRRRLVERIRADAQALPAARPAARRRAFFPVGRGAWRGSAPALRAALVVALLAVMTASFTGTVSASQAAVPGEALYPVKRWTEQVSYAFAFNDVQRANLEMNFTQRRFDEIAALFDRGDFARLQAAVDAYEHEMDRAVSLVMAFGNDGDLTGEDSIAAKHLKADYARNTEVLTALLLRAPDAAIPGLTRALEASQHHTSEIDSALDDGDDQPAGAHEPKEKPAGGEENSASRTPPAGKPEKPPARPTSKPKEASKTSPAPAKQQPGGAVDHPVPAVTPTPRPTHTPKATREEKSNPAVEPTATTKSANPHKPTSQPTPERPVDVPTKKPKP